MSKSISSHKKQDLVIINYGELSQPRLETEPNWLCLLILPMPDLWHLPRWLRDVTTLTPWSTRVKSLLSFVILRAQLWTAVIYKVSKKARVLLVNIRLGWKGLPGSNTPAYYKNLQILDKNLAKLFLNVHLQSRNHLVSTLYPIFIFN